VTEGELLERIRVLYEQLLEANAAVEVLAARLKKRRGREEIPRRQLLDGARRTLERNRAVLAGLKKSEDVHTHSGPPRVMLPGPSSTSPGRLR
jgi:hypothetical protein